MSTDGQKSAERVPEKKENEAPSKPDPKPQCSEAPSSVVLPKTNEPPAPRHQCRKRYKCIKEEIKYWFEVAAIIGGLIGLVLIWLQYKDMTRATLATITQSKALLRQSELMQQQLNEMRESQKLDQRPWVLLSDIITTRIFTNSTSATIQISFKNIGRTPAFNVQTVVYLKQDTNAIPETDIMPNPPVNGGIYAPGQGGSVQPVNVPTRMVNEFQKQKAFYIFGRVQYSDIFTSNHWTQFCFEVVPEITDLSKMEFIPTPFHNSTDDTRAQ